jgi:hypothetical protein
MITTMSDTAAIFRREFAARRDLLWAAVYIAVLIVVVPLWPFISHFERADVRDLMSVGSALGAGLALSIGLGATFFGRDLSEGRLGFYFERPVRSVAVWLGRFLAVLTLVVLFEVLTLIPGWLGSSDGLTIMMYVGWPKDFGAIGWAVVLLAGPAFLLLLAHAVGVMVRARTAWLFLDVIGVVVATMTAWVALRPLVAGGFDRAVQVVGLGIVAGVLIALLLAGVIGLVHGRADLPRTHRFLSTTLWGVLIVTFGGLFGYSTWLMSFGPENFQVAGVGYVSPNGQWVEVEGSAKGRLDVRRSFLVSADGKRVFPIPGILERRRGLQTFVRVSDDGSRAVWVKPSADGKLGTLWWMDLRTAEFEPVATTITLSGDPRLEISPDGSSVAFIDNQTLSVFDLREERLLTVVRADEPYSLRFRYTSPDNLRLMETTYEDLYQLEWKRSLAFSDLAVRRGAQPQVRNIVRDSKSRFVHIDPGLEYVVPGFDTSGSPTRAANLQQRVFDAGSGALVKEVKGSFGGFLPEGWFWSLDVPADGMATLVFDSLRPTGQTSTIDLGALPQSIVVGGHVGGVAFIARDHEYRDRSPSGAWKGIEAFDLETGAHRPVGRNLEIIGLWLTYVELPGGKLASSYGTGSSATLFRDENGALLAWDLVGKHLTRIAGRPSS